MKEVEIIRYFDLHCDTITECSLKNKELFDNDLHISVKKTEDYSTWVQTFAIWIPDTVRGKEAFERFLHVEKTFENQINKNNMAFCKSSEDFESALKNNKKNIAFLSIEGSAALGGNLENLKTCYDLGVRFMTITWNGECEAAGGCKDGRGFTDFGKEMIKKMNELSIIADISHLSDKGMEDLFSFSDKPIIATHSDSREVCDHKRNLTDDEFKEIVKRGGIVGLNLYPPFLGSTDYLKITEHVDRFLKLGGEKNISLGCDFDGADMPNGINNITDMKKIYELFVKNYGETVANAIFFDNAHKFITTVLTH